MKEFISTKRVKAEPQVRDGVAGYHLVYGTDGYESWCPAEVFQRDYQSLGSMSFGHALVLMRQGVAVARKGWNGKGMWLRLQVPDSHSKMTLPYIYMEYPKDHPAYPDGCRVPWLASQTDMLANDWGVAP